MEINLKSLTAFQLFLMRTCLRKRREDGRFHKEYLRKEEKELLEAIKYEMNDRGLGNNLDALHNRFDDCFYNLESWVESNEKPKDKIWYDNRMRMLTRALKIERVSFLVKKGNPDEPEYIKIFSDGKVNKSWQQLLKAHSLYHIFRRVDKRVEPTRGTYSKLDRFIYFTDLLISQYPKDGKA